MRFFMKAVLPLSLCLTTTAAWSGPVDFCKTKKVYATEIGIPDKIVYEDCSGVAFLWYARDFVKAACWEGATDLAEGKCETHDQEDNQADAESKGAEQSD